MLSYHQVQVHLDFMNIGYLRVYSLPTISWNCVHRVSDNNLTFCEQVNTTGIELSVIYLFLFYLFILYPGMPGWSFSRSWSYG